MFNPQFSGRYSKLLKEIFIDMGAIEILREDFIDDWQGFVDVDVLLADGRVVSYYYTYGSCSGCDEWEYLGYNNDEIKENMKKGFVIFDSIEEYKQWLKMKENNHE